MMADYRSSSVHNHSNLCDGKSSLGDMAYAAWQAGVQTLGFSGHSHTPCDLEYCMSPGRTAQYKAEIARLKKQYAGKMDILCGLEWDEFSDTEPSWYDYWIGSVHYIQGPKTGKYYEIDWRPQDLLECLQEEFEGNGLAMAKHYFDHVAQVAAKHPTILGHFDLIKKLNCTGSFFDEESAEYKEAALDALRRAFEGCKVLEINTGGAYRGYRNDFYPALFLLEEWKKLGGQVIITGDAHDTKSILWGFEEAAAYAKQAGFTHSVILTAKGIEEAEL